MFSGCDYNLLTNGFKFGLPECRGPQLERTLGRCSVATLELFFVFVNWRRNLVGELTVPFERESYSGVLLVVSAHPFGRLWFQRLFRRSGKETHQSGSTTKHTSLAPR